MENKLLIFSGPVVPLLLGHLFSRKKGWPHKRGGYYIGYKGYSASKREVLHVVGITIPRSRSLNSLTCRVVEECCLLSNVDWVVLKINTIVMVTQVPH